MKSFVNDFPRQRRDQTFEVNWLWLFVHFSWCHCCLCYLISLFLIKHLLGRLDQILCKYNKTTHHFLSKCWMIIDGAPWSIWHWYMGYKNVIMANRSAKNYVITTILYKIIQWHVENDQVWIHFFSSNFAYILLIYSMTNSLLTRCFVLQTLWTI